MGGHLTPPAESDNQPSPSGGRIIVIKKGLSANLHCPFWTRHRTDIDPAHTPWKQFLEYALGSLSLQFRVLVLVSTRLEYCSYSKIKSCGCLLCRSPPFLSIKPGKKCICGLGQTPAHIWAFSGPAEAGGRDGEFAFGVSQ